MYTRVTSLPSFFRGARLQYGLAVGVILLLALVPFILLGTNSYVVVHDNLDSEFMYLTNLVRTGTAFDYGSEARLENVMNGLPRAALRSGLDLTVVLFSLFSPLVAYVVNSLVVRAIAFLGMLLLLRDWALPGERHRPQRIALAVVFSLLPFYTLYGISTAGQPLLFWAYGSIQRDGARWYHWLVVALFPFYSLLYIAGLFVGLAFGLYALYQSLRRRQIAWNALVPVLLLGGGYLLANWPMISGALFDSTWTTHRVEFSRAAGDVMATGWTTLLFGHYHAAEFPVLPIIITLGLAGSALLRSDRRNLAGLLLIAITIVIVTHAVYTPFVHIAGDRMPLLKEIQLDRFYFFLPLLWFLLFGIGIEALHRSPRSARLVSILIAIQAGAVLYYSSEIRNNVAIVLGREVHPSYREFFDADLFADIRGSLEPAVTDFRVVALGMHPSVLQYNGFYTLDSYQNNYPLAYKHLFRGIIAPELAKDSIIRAYFDNWGNRAYIFSAELGQRYDWSKREMRAVGNLAFDTRQFQRMGGRYLISAVPILNSSAIHFELREIFETPSSFRRIYLYEVDSALTGANGPA